MCFGGNMKKTVSKEDNFMALIPVKNERIEWMLDDLGFVQLVIKRNRRFEKIIRKFFKSPETMTMSLDAIGSIVWQAIDNRRDIATIAEILKIESTEPLDSLYERVRTYINILKHNKFIELKNNE